MGPLLPILVISLAGGAYFRGSTEEKNKGVLTPERALVFETALNEVKDPAKLNKLAEAFRKAELAPQADLLEKRAKLRELPAPVKAERREAFRKGMSSHDTTAINNLAEAFEKQGATGAANALRKYASSLNPPATVAK